MSPLTPEWPPRRHDPNDPRQPSPAPPLSGYSGNQTESGWPPAGRAWTVRVIYQVLPAVLVVAVFVIPLSVWSRLPAQVAVHWGASGEANGAQLKLPAFIPCVLLGIIGAGIMWCFKPRPVGGPPVAAARGAAGIGLFLLGLAASLSMVLTRANLDVVDWRQAQFGVAGGLGLVLGGPVALAAVGTFAIRRWGPAASKTPVSHVAPRGREPAQRWHPPRSPAAGLGADAVWVGRARSVWIGPLAIGVLAYAVVEGTRLWWGAGIFLGVIGLGLLLFTSVRVIATPRGVRVAYSVLRLPLTRIPIQRITAAAATDLVAMSWGYRGSLRLFRKAAVVIRGGAALQLDLDGGKRQFVVTIDDAQNGAAFINKAINTPRLDTP